MANRDQELPAQGRATVLRDRFQVGDPSEPRSASPAPVDASRHCPWATGHERTGLGTASAQRCPRRPLGNPRERERAIEFAFEGQDAVLVDPTTTITEEIL